MIDLSDSEASVDYSSPEDDADFQFDTDEEGDLDLNDAKSEAVRKGFSLHPHDDHHSTPKGKDFLSTQPASQSSAIAPQRRISPRRRSPANHGGITSAILGVIQGETTVTQGLVPPKTAAPQTSKPQQSLPPVTQAKKPPVKKRKVSLSPTDSLAKQRPLIRGEESAEVVIDLMGDDDDDQDLPPPALTKPGDKLTPEALAIAKQQQKEHIAAAKKKQKSSEANQKTPSKVSNITYAAAPAGSESLPAKKRPAPTYGESQTTTTTALPAATASSATDSVAKTKQSKKQAKSDAPAPKAKKASPKKTTKASAGNDTAAKTTAKKSKVKTAKSTQPKTNTTDVTDTKGKTQAATTLAETAKTVTSEPKAKTTKNAKRKNTDIDVENPSEKNTAAKTKAAAAAKKPTAAKAKPPAKKKQKRMTFENELLQKMFLTCKPYAMKDLIQLMGKTASEASVNFCLLSLIDKKWVVKKEFKSGNRTKELYWANQESRDKKLWALDCLQFPDMETIRQGRLELANLQQQQKSLARDIEAVERTPSNDQLTVLCQSAQAEVDVLRKQLEGMKARIASSSAPNPKANPRFGGGMNRFGARPGFHKAKPKKARTPLQLKKKINSMRDHWVKRKRKCMDFVDALADGMEKKVKDVINKVLELETDEAENVKLPPKHEI